MGADRTAIYGVAGASDGRTASGWTAAVRARRPSTRRGPGRVTTMSSTGTMAPALTALRTSQPGRSAMVAAVTPYAASPRTMISGSPAIDLLGRHLPVRGTPRRDRLGPGEREHLGVDRVVGDAVDRLVERPGLVEHARLRQRGRRGRDLVEPGLHRGGQILRRIGLADGGADELDVAQRMRHVRRVHDEDGHPDRTQLRNGVGVRPEIAAGDDQVGAKSDDLLGVDPFEGRDHRQAGGFGREVRDVLDPGDDAVTDTELEQDLGRGRRERDDLRRLRRQFDGRAVVVGQRDRERGERGRRGRRGRGGGGRDGRCRGGARGRGR